MGHGTLLKTCVMVHHHHHHRQEVKKGPSNYLRLILLLAVFSGFLSKKFLAALNLLPPMGYYWEEAPTKGVIVVVQQHPPKITGLKKKHRRRQEKPQKNNFTFCLLLKDDNEVLNEWLAYHYHTINLRHLIVAIDPSSSTSPSLIFQEWRQLFGLQVEEWTDSDFMPDFFLKGNYHEIPFDFLHVTNRSNTVWHTSAGVTDMKIIERELQVINNHRYRQVFFLHKCAQTLRKRYEQSQQQQNDDSSWESMNSSRKILSPMNSTTTTNTNTTSPKDEPSTTTTAISSSLWMAHIDTDEYIVLNPLIRARNPVYLQSIQPSGPHPSSLLNFLEVYASKYPKSIQRKCIAMGMVRFGAVEDHEDKGTTLSNRNANNSNIIHEEEEEIPTGAAAAAAAASTTSTKRTDTWNRSHFETFRWRYYGAAETTANQKTIMDIASIPHDDLLFHEVAYSIHRPSFQQCREFPWKRRAAAVNMFRKYPLSLNHYLGSYERYSSRSDVRRNPVLYQKHANVSDGGKDDDWLSGWLDSFTQTHGHERVARVLKEYLL
jgi:hypothetical protein